MSQHSLPILVVEDDPSIAATLVRGLKEAGYEVELVNDGAQAQRTIVANPPHLVILDFMLPVLPSWPTVVTCHDLAYLSSPETFTFKQRLWKKSIARSASGNAARIVCDSNFVAKELGVKLPDPHPDVRAQWKVFDQFIALMTPRGFAGLMTTMWPELIDAMPLGMGPMMRAMGKVPGALEAMKPMLPVLFPKLLPLMMPKVLPVMLERIKADLNEQAVVEQFPKMEGRQLIMVLAPSKKQAKH